MSRLEELNYLICRCMDIDFYSNSEVFRTKFTRMNKKEWHNIEPYQIRYLDKIYDCSSQIQKFLENYKYPVDLISSERRPDDSKFLRPMFVDTTDLSTLDSSYKRLRDAIVNSNYMVVLCFNCSIHQ